MSNIISEVNTNLAISRNYIIKTTQSETTASANSVTICFPSEGKYKNPTGDICKGTQMIVCCKDSESIICLAEFKDVRSSYLPSEKSHQFCVANLTPKFGEKYRQIGINYKDVIKRYNRLFNAKINTRKLTNCKHVLVDQHFFDFVVGVISNQCKLFQSRCNSVSSAAAVQTNSG